MRPEAPYGPEAAARLARVRDVFAEIAPVYDQANGLMSLGLHRRWREAAVRTLSPRQGSRVLDLCCGTGEFFVPLRRAVGGAGTVVGADVCRPMLERAAGRDPAALAVVADACRLPFPDETFDGATVGWGLRNVPDLSLCLAEAWRVLRPGARLVSLDTARPSGPAWAAFRLATRLVGASVGKPSAYEYLATSTAGFASPEALAGHFREAGFRATGHRSMFFGAIGMVWGEK
jgi:demethylmenaquinone methyltransferase/2-methoxy-6-polyprenyl-1,4-benzoquinol methylase